MSDFYLLGLLLAAAATIPILEAADQESHWSGRLFILVIAAICSWATLAFWFGVLVAAVVGIEKRLSEKEDEGDWW